MKWLFARFGLRSAAVSAGIVLLSLVTAHAEDVRSERDAATKHDPVSKLKPELERRKSALMQEGSVQRADDLRQILKARAEAYEALHDFDRAEAEYQDFVDVKPVDPTVYIDRGYFYMRRSRFDAAIRDFITGSRLAPAQPAFNYGAGRALVRMGDYAAAIRHYSEAIRLAPDDCATVLSRAEAYAQLGMYEQARADFDRVIVLSPRQDMDRFLVYLGRGYANIRLGDNDAAIHDLDAALSMRPGAINALVWRGYARERLGLRDLALSDYEAVLRQNPDDNWIRSSIKRTRT